MKFCRCLIITILLFGPLGCGSKSDSTVLVQSAAGQYIVMADLATAVGSDDSAGGTIVVSTAQTVSDNLAIPSTRALQVETGAQINIASGKTLTINGPFVAGLYRVFTGDGTVRFDQKYTRVVYPEWWGHKGDGVTDGTTAMTSAMRTGIPINLSEGVYKQSTITYSGKLVIIGKGKSSSILCDGYAFVIADGDGSNISRIHFQGPMGAYIVNRWDGEGNWTASTYGWDLTDGYQLAGNDPEWAALPENRKTYKVTGLKFISSDYVDLSEIYGRFVSLWLIDTNYSTVKDCDIQAGATTFGGIYFGASSAAKLKGNRVENNTVRYATNCGITFEGQNGIVVNANTLLMNGESGIKSMQNTYPSVNYIISNNISKANYYDGIDLLTNYPVTGSGSPSAVVTGNYIINNRLSGLSLEGTGNNAKGNNITGSGAFGIWANVGDSRIDGNTVNNNNTSSLPGYASVFIMGNNNTFSYNTIKNSLPTYQVNLCLYLKGDSNTYYGNDLYAGLATSAYIEGTNNTGYDNKGFF